MKMRTSTIGVLLLMAACALLAMLPIFGCVDSEPIQSDPLTGEAVDQPLIKLNDFLYRVYDPELDVYCYISDIHTTGGGVDCLTGRDVRDDGGR